MPRLVPLRPNDLRISCKRLARLALSYVPRPAIGVLPSTQLRASALVGCMRGLGGALREFNRKNRGARGGQSH